jgi:hypothetical protein
LVTVALESWQFYCKPVKPSRGGFVRLRFVRLRADATRVSSVLQQGKSSPSLKFPAFPVRRLERVSSRVSFSAGGSFVQKREESRSHLFSALLVSR